MQTKDAIKFAANRFERSVAERDRRDEQCSTTFPTPNGGCHSLWVLGHLTLVRVDPGGIFSETRIPQQSGNNTLVRARNPSPDPDAYPPFAEVS